MSRRPPGLIYWEDERPPNSILVLLAVQHVFLMSSTLVLPVVLISELGGGFDQIRGVVAFTMIACGIGTIAQAMRLPGFGSGFLCPNLCGPNFFGASMGAAWLGGLPLMRGMTIAAGLFEALFARVVRRLGFLFPPEITGLVVLMVAVGLVPLGTSKFLGITYPDEPISNSSPALAAATLMAMIAVNVWSKGKLRLYGVLIGMVVGYVLSLATGVFGPDQLEQLGRSPWLAFPQIAGMTDISFRWALLPGFLIVSITGALKSMGNLTMCEKVNDADWKEPDLDRMSGGLLADSVAVTVSGLLGGMASDTSASNVALSSASGATSRYIGYSAGALFILLGFSPKIAGLLSVMPVPVMGAILIFVTSFMILSGIQIILASKVDAQKIFVVGVAFVFGLSLDILPGLYAGITGWLRPLFSSSLTLATVIAVILNQLLRIRPGFSLRATMNP
ncbi:MAG TPA: solute carrier family 23 protein [Thermoanaerobaculia bacterium]|jgi:NCS2 family nucleobase:cation symporter-2